MLKRTPLFAVHQQAGARLIEFGGWEMPVHYTSIVDEHLAVRRAAGLFDISHMGEFLVTGPGAASFLNQTLTNDLRKLSVGQGQYTLLCNGRGGVVDDLYVFRIETDEYLLIVNASRITADWDWLQEQVDLSSTRDGFRVFDASNDLGALAVQGPSTASFIETVLRGGSIGGGLVSCVTDLKKNEIAAFVFDGGSVHVGRTGYTGEDGFEIVALNNMLERLWRALMEAGHEFGLKPAGLGARDTLRTEMCYPLYGNELNESTTPLEAGLGAFVAWDKGEFVGRPVLAVQKAEGIPRRCVAFKMTDRSAPPRPHYPIFSTGTTAARIGEVVSGTQSPSLGIGIGLGYVPTTHSEPGTALEIEIRSRRAPAVIVRKPIYRRVQ